MKYATAGAFRAALEDRLRLKSASRGQAWLIRQRKLIAFDRFLARLLVVAPDRWLLKGAVALDLRFGDQARATRDLDVQRREHESAATIDLQLAQCADLSDFFQFQVQRTEAPDALTDGVAVRYRVRTELAGRLFEEFSLDVGFSDPEDMPVDILRGPDFLRFAGIPPIEVPALPLEQHVAEKLHAYTRIYADGRQSSRAKDLVDLVLIQSSASLEARYLRAAIDRTFSSRHNQPIPTAIPTPPDDWTSNFERLAGEIGLQIELQSGHQLAAAFLDPILSGSAPDDAQWNPQTGICQQPKVSKDQVK